MELKAWGEKPSKGWKFLFNATLNLPKQKNNVMKLR